MSLSLNETHKLVKDAARGCGLSWGEADELARATVWLEVIAFLGASNAVAAIEEISEQDISDVDLTRNGNWRIAPRGAAEQKNVSTLRAGLLARDLLAGGAQQGGAMPTICIERFTLPIMMCAILAQYEPAPELELVVDQFGGDVDKTPMMVKRSDEIWFESMPWPGPFRAEVRLVPRHSSAVCAEMVCIWTPQNTLSAIQNGLSPDEERLDALRTLARGCLVPATEESRLKGAGAGTVDRD